MKIKLLAAVLIWGCGFGNAVFAQNYFTNKYQEPVNATYTNYASSAVSNQKNCIYLTGGVVPGTVYPYAVKLDLNGNIIWSKQYFTPYETWTLAMVTTLDGGLTIGGYCSINFFYSIFLAHIDSSGNMQWFKLYQQNNQQLLLKLLSTPDNGYLMTCTMNKNNINHGMLIKTDSAGTVSWTERIHPDTDGSSLKETVITKTGDFLSVGHQGNHSNGPNQFFPIIWKVNAQGKSKKLKKLNHNWGTHVAIKETSDSGFYVSSSIAEFDTSWVTASVIKLDKSLNFEWSKKVEPSKFDINFTSDNINHLVLDSDYFYIKIDTLGVGADYKHRVLKIDKTGNLIWSKKIESQASYYMMSLDIYNNCIYMGTVGNISGVGKYFHKLDKDLNNSCYIYDDSLILKEISLSDTTIQLSHHPKTQNETSLNFNTLNLPFGVTNFCNLTDIPQISNKINLTISPNPATDKIYISFPATASESITTKIFSITGEVVYENLFQSAYGGLEKLNAAIDITGLSNGIYLLSVQTGRELVTRKIVVNH